MDIKSIKDLLHRFSEIDKNGDGLINEEEFAQFLNLPPCKEVSTLFNLYDQVSLILRHSRFLIVLFNCATPLKFFPFDYLHCCRMMMAVLTLENTLLV